MSNIGPKLRSKRLTKDGKFVVQLNNSDDIFGLLSESISKNEELEHKYKEALIRINVLQEIKLKLHDEKGYLKGNFYSSKLSILIQMSLDTLRTKNESQESRIDSLQEQIAEKVGIIVQLRKDLDKAQAEDKNAKANVKQLNVQLQLAYDYIR